jgi:hypothetical protein
VENLQKEIEQLEEVLSSLANLSNLELLNNYPFEIGYNAGEFQPLKNLDALSSLEYLAGLANFSLPSFLDKEKAQSLNSALRSALAYLGYLSYLSNLSIIDQQYNFLGDGCYISEDLPCGLGSLQFLETLADFNKEETALTKLAFVAPFLKYLSELKIYSDPVFAANIEKTIDLSGLSLDNLAPLSELEKLIPKEEEVSLDKEIERLKNEIRLTFVNQGIELPQDFDLAAFRDAFDSAILATIKEEFVKKTGSTPEILRKEITNQIEKESGALHKDFDLERLIYKLKIKVYSELVKEGGYAWDFGYSEEEVESLIKAKTQEIVDQTLPGLLEEEGISLKIPNPYLKESLINLTSVELNIQLREKINLNQKTAKEVFKKELENLLKMEFPEDLEGIDLELLHRNYESRVRAIRAKIARKKPWVRRWDDHLTQIAPEQIYKPKAIKTVRDLVSLGLSLPEPDRPHQILASIKLGETSTLTPNYGSMLSSLYTKVHFGF